MKTIKQVADALGVSRQAIYRRLASLPSAMLSATDKGVQLINTEGEALLKDLLSAEQYANSPNSTADSTTDKLIQMLQQELELKNEQLTVKDKQIAELTATIKIQAESINAAHHNELAETFIDGQAKISAPASEKTGFWNKLFKRKN